MEIAQVLAGLLVATLLLFIGVGIYGTIGDNIETEQTTFENEIPVSSSAFSAGPPTIDTRTGTVNEYVYLHPMQKRGAAEKLDSPASVLADNTYNSVTAKLSKTSTTANGILTFGVFNSTGSAVHTFGTLNATTLTTSDADYSVNGTARQLAAGDYVGVSYAGVNGTGNSSIKFDGSNDFVAANSGLILANQTQSLTVTGWINKSVNGTYTLFGNHQTSTTKGLSFGISSTNKLTFTMYGSDASHTLISQTANNAFTNNAWHQVAVTYNGTRVCFFVDLVQDCKTNSGSNITLNANSGVNFRLGHRQSAGAGVEFYNGYQDEFRVYNSVLSSSDLSTLYYGGNVASNLRAHYAMNEGTGTTTADSSGNAFTGTFGASTAAPTWQGSYINDYLKLGLLSDTNYGIVLDGVNDATGDYLNTNSQLVLPNATQTFSVSAWVKRSAEGNGQILASLRDSTKSGMFFHITEGDPPGDPATRDKLELRFYTSNTFGGQHTSRGWITADLTVPLDQWVLVGVTFDGNQPTFYLNDASEQGGRLQTTVGVRQNTGDNYYIGWRQAAGSGFEHFPGTIADLRVYTRQLSGAEMLALYNHEAVSTTGFRVHYAMTEGTGTTTADSRGTLGAATLTNGPTWEYSPTAGTNRFDGTDTIAATLGASSFTDKPESDLAGYVAPSVTYPASNARDSNAVTYWQSANIRNTTEYITGDIGALVDGVASIAITKPDADMIPATVDISLSADGSSWTKVLSSYELEQGTGQETITIPDEYNDDLTRYVKIQPVSYGLTAKTMKISELQYETVDVAETQGGQIVDQIWGILPIVSALMLVPVLALIHKIRG